MAVLSFSGLEPLTVQPWLAVVAMRMMPIKISPINALRVRSPGMRILYIYSVLVLRFWLACGEPMGHTPPCENRRWQYIPTDVAQYSIGSGVAGPSDLSPEYRFSPFVLKLLERAHQPSSGSSEIGLVRSGGSTGSPRAASLDTVLNCSPQSSIMERPCSVKNALAITAWWLQPG